MSLDINLNNQTSKRYEEQGIIPLNIQDLRQITRSNVNNTFNCKVFNDIKTIEIMGIVSDITIKPYKKLLTIVDPKKQAITLEITSDTRDYEKIGKTMKFKKNEFISVFCYIKNTNGIGEYPDIITLAINRHKNNNILAYKVHQLDIELCYEQHANPQLDEEPFWEKMMDPEMVDKKHVKDKYNIKQIIINTCLNNPRGIDRVQLLHKCKSHNKLVSLKELTDMLDFLVEKDMLYMRGALYLSPWE